MTMRTDDETPIEIPAGLVARVVGVLREAGARQQVLGLDGAGKSMLELANHLELVASVALVAAREGQDDEYGPSSK